MRCTKGTNHLQSEIYVQSDTIYEISPKIKWKDCYQYLI